jgi:hypothetical protein
MRSGKTGKLTHVTDESVLLDARDGLLVHHPAVLPIEISDVLVFATACFTIVITLGHDRSWRKRLCGSFMTRHSFPSYRRTA